MRLRHQEGRRMKQVEYIYSLSKTLKNITTHLHKIMEKNTITVLVEDDSRAPDTTEALHSCVF